MIIYDVDYNVIDGYTVDQCFYNAKELKKYKMPRNNLSLKELEDVMTEIPGHLWPQFKVTEWNNDIIDLYGIPELVKSLSMIEWRND